jgi:hypothetical protein
MRTIKILTGKITISYPDSFMVENIIKKEVPHNIFL